MRALLPNLLTLGNLICGVAGIVLSFQAQMEWAGVLVFAAMGFDFLDGMAARMLNVQGELGKQLDSLADMVTFGVLPGIIFFHLISISRGTYFIPLLERESIEIIIPAAGWLITCFACLRLAKFNIDKRQSEHFIGMPTPAIAAIAAAIPIVLGWQLSYNFYHPPTSKVITLMTDIHLWDAFDIGVVMFFQTDFILIGLAILLSLIMVMPFQIVSLKFKNLRWTDNRFRYIFLIMSGLTILLSFWNYIFLTQWLPFVEWMCIPIIIAELLIVSIARWWFEKP
jgi:CDP-diacylglycerol--serine O-phosphatidyltransferase